jgi:hypothetical protein
MHGQLLAPRHSTLEYEYRLFGDFLEILRFEHDRLLAIEEAMESLNDLHEFRKRYAFRTVEPSQNEFTFKSVKNRTPTLTKLPSLRDLMDLVPSPSPSYKSVTPPPVSPSGYSSSSSSSSESTTTTVTTTVKYQWNDSDQSSTCSSSPHPDRFC